MFGPELDAVEVFGSGGILQGSDGCTKTWRMAGESFVIDDEHTIVIVVAHRWNMLMAIFDTDTKQCLMVSRLLQGLPRVLCIMSLAPPKSSMIDGVRASVPRRRSEQWASARARVH